MVFVKKGPIEKLYLKLSNYNAYRQYKQELRSYELKNQKKNNSRRPVKNIHVVKSLKEKAELRVLHSGHAGDIIYALPTLKKIAELKTARINVYLKVGQAAALPSHYHTHPQGMFLLNDNMANNLIPLIQDQPYIQHCSVYNNEEIDIDLDAFRDGIFNVSSGSIPKWYGYVTGVNPDLWKKWIFVEQDNVAKDSIIISRSARYLNQNIDFSFLDKYDRIKFIGLQSEYDTISKAIKKVEWIQIKDFAEMASIICGCRLFIGNQSLPYALAEALKVPRILEVFPDAPNVVPEGPNGYDYYLQEHLELLVDRLYS
ncbi:hypothetical protein [Arcticibacter sp.]|jgi:hypothetical protein|uniref:hypothetical protein n=1 Tax=Arcticibacter sp. TaxID=1872630 RepID=UPI00388DF0D5